MRLALPADRESYLRRKAIRFQLANQKLEQALEFFHMTLVDQDNRRRAMTDFTSVLLVEAAAGTGKTSLMAGRVAMMLASGYPPGDIAAITFTELAASQLARRIKETVDALLAGDDTRISLSLCSLQTASPLRSGRRSQRRRRGLTS